MLTRPGSHALSPGTRRPDARASLRSRRPAHARKGPRMARQSTSTSKAETRTKADQDASAPSADPVATAVAAHGTGQEPSTTGVHVPGSAPGQYTDHGPVTLPADAPRSR